jgi:hypothetical protein
MYTTHLLLKGLDFSTLEYYSRNFDILVEGLVDYYTLRLNVVKSSKVIATRDIDLFNFVELSGDVSRQTLQEQIWYKAQEIKTEFIFDYQNLLHAA